jgi:hypothetical protein
VGSRCICIFAPEWESNAASPMPIDTSQRSHGFNAQIAPLSRTVDLQCSDTLSKSFHGNNNQNPDTTFPPPHHLGNSTCRFIGNARPLILRLRFQHSPGQPHFRLPVPKRAGKSSEPGIGMGTSPEADGWCQVVKMERRGHVESPDVQLSHHLIKMSEEGTRRVDSLWGYLVALCCVARIDGEDMRHEASDGGGMPPSYPARRSLAAEPQRLCAMRGRGKLKTGKKQTSSDLRYLYVCVLFTVRSCIQKMQDILNNPSIHPSPCHIPALKCNSILLRSLAPQPIRMRSIAKRYQPSASFGCWLASAVHWTAKIQNPSPSPRSQVAIRHAVPTVAHAVATFSRIFARSWVPNQRLCSLRPNPPPDRGLMGLDDQERGGNKQHTCALH